MYCFYVKNVSEWTLFNAAYLKETLTQDSFAGLRNGDPLEAVGAIDSACKTMSDYLLKPGGFDRMTDYQTVHLLKDGLLVIDYQKTGQTFCIQEIRYFADFKFEAPFQNFDLTPVIYNYAILPRDYPE